MPVSRKSVRMRRTLGSRGLRQCENCCGNTTNDIPSLRPATCRPPRMTVSCMSCAGTRGPRFAPSDPTTALRAKSKSEWLMNSSISGARICGHKFGRAIIADIGPRELVDVPDAVLGRGRTTRKCDRRKPRGLRFRKRAVARHIAQAQNWQGPEQDLVRTGRTNPRPKVVEIGPGVLLEQLVIEVDRLRRNHLVIFVRPRDCADDELLHRENIVLPVGPKRD